MRDCDIASSGRQSTLFAAADPAEVLQRVIPFLLLLAAAPFVLPIISLVSPSVLVGATKGLGNFRPTVLDHHALWNVEELFWRRRSPGAPQ